MVESSVLAAGVLLPVHCDLDGLHSHHVPKGQARTIGQVFKVQRLRDAVHHRLSAGLDVQHRCQRGDIPAPTESAAVHRHTEILDQHRWLAVEGGDVDLHT